MPEIVGADPIVENTLVEATGFVATEVTLVRR
jgi:hypothetical protein